MKPRDCDRVEARRHYGKAIGAILAGHGALAVAELAAAVALDPKVTGSRFQASLRTR